MTLNKKTLYIYKHWKIQSYKKKQNKIKKQKKMENGCASKVLVVGSSIGLSSLPWVLELLQVPTVSEVGDLLLP